MFVICARGVFAVPGAELIMMPLRPLVMSVERRQMSHRDSPYEARKHANDAPAGPAPTIKKSVSVTLELCPFEECRPVS